MTWINMKKQRCLIVLFSGCLLCACAPSQETAEEAWYALVNKQFSKSPKFSFVRGISNFPNVLLYGDSISIGYTMQVQRRLKGKANVYRIHGNGKDSASFIPNMTIMHRVMRNKSLPGHWSFEWDVIHFNVGLHDLKYMLNDKLDKENGRQFRSIEEYEDNIRDIVTYLHKFSPNTILIFATTTPVPIGAAGRFPRDVIKYNQVALKVINEHPEIIVNDLYSFTTPDQSKWWRLPADVHYGPEGQAAQGAEVARVILKALEASVPAEQQTPEITGK